MCVCVWGGGGGGGVRACVRAYSCVRVSACVSGVRAPACVYVCVWGGGGGGVGVSVCILHIIMLDPLLMSILCVSFR